jgi:hypothetical protein
MDGAVNASIDGGSLSGMTITNISILEVDTSLALLLDVSCWNLGLVVLGTVAWTRCYGRLCLGGMRMDDGDWAFSVAGQTVTRKLLLKGLHAVLHLSCRRSLVWGQPIAVHTVVDAHR